MQGSGGAAAAASALAYTITFSPQRQLDGGGVIIGEVLRSKGGWEFLQSLQTEEASGGEPVISPRSSSHAITVTSCSVLQTGEGWRQGLGSERYAANLLYGSTSRGSGDGVVAPPPLPAVPPAPISFISMTEEEIRKGIDEALKGVGMGAASRNVVIKAAPKAAAGNPQVSREPPTAEPPLRLDDSIYEM